MEKMKRFKRRLSQTLRGSHTIDESLSELAEQMTIEENGLKDSGEFKEQFVVVLRWAAHLVFCFLILCGFMDVYGLYRPLLHNCSAVKYNRIKSLTASQRQWQHYWRTGKKYFERLHQLWIFIFILQLNPFNINDKMNQAQELFSLNIIIII